MNQLVTLQSPGTLLQLLQTRRKLGAGFKIYCMGKIDCDMLIISAHNKTRIFHGIKEITENEKYAQNYFVFELPFDSLEYLKRYSGIFSAAAA